MKEDRARLMKDHAVIGEGVPMVGCDGQQINVGDVLYTGIAGVSGYNNDVHLEVEFEAWRVIQINYKERYYRIRNDGGCEESIHHGEKGCPVRKVYHNFKNVASNVRKQLQKEAKKTEKKIKEKQVLLEEINKEAQHTTTMDAPAAPELIESEAA